MIDLPELFILDVGHGNCAILKDSNVITVIDCPPSLVLVEVLERLGIDTIDNILISHSDVDHVGGLSNLLQNIFIRNKFENPRKETVEGTILAVPNTHIMCTQLSKNCAIKTPTSDFRHLTNLPAGGAKYNNCCGGTVWVKINGEQTTYLPSLTDHRSFIEDKIMIPTPLCLRCIKS